MTRTFEIKFLNLCSLKTLIKIFVALLSPLADANDVGGGGTVSVGSMQHETRRVGELTSRLPL